MGIPQRTRHWPSSVLTGARGARPLSFRASSSSPRRPARTRQDCSSGTGGAASRLRSGPRRLSCARRPERARHGGPAGLPQPLSEQPSRDRASRAPAFVISLQAEAQGTPPTALPSSPSRSVPSTARGLPVARCETDAVRVVETRVRAGARSRSERAPRDSFCGVHQREPRGRFVDVTVACAAAGARPPYRSQSWSAIGPQ